MFQNFLERIEFQSEIASRPRVVSVLCSSMPEDLFAPTFRMTTVGGSSREVEGNTKAAVGANSKMPNEANSKIKASGAQER